LSKFNHGGGGSESKLEPHHDQRNPLPVPLALLAVVRLMSGSSGDPKPSQQAHQAHRRGGSSSLTGYHVMLRAALAALSAAALAQHALCEVHSFYYVWYGAPPTDGAYKHWDHSILPHWTAAVREQYPGKETRWVPPDDIHAPFYPSRGLYSSLDAPTIVAHMEDLKAHGVAAAIVSWWGRAGVSSGDSQGVLTDDALGKVLDACAAVGGIGVALHLEPYEGRTAASVAEDLAHLHSRFGNHSGLHRAAQGGKPVFYVYDSYHVPPGEWARVLAPGGDLSVRGTQLDGLFLGLWLERPHGQELRAGGFDGAYTYFASDGFSYGSTTAHWAGMAAEASSLGLLLVPSVGPGYDDSKIRPWNAASVREREGGRYYEKMWRAALAMRPTPRIVSVTSYNEWGEGTQIEGAVAREIDVDALAPQGKALPRGVRERLRLLVQDRYRDYEEEGGAQAYMLRTRAYAEELEGLLRKHSQEL
jgi:glycoprotein endo-alpha-1,2-mannosidase